MNEQGPGDLENIEKDPAITASEAIEIILKAIDEQPERFSHLSSEQLDDLKMGIKELEGFTEDIDDLVGNLEGLLQQAYLEDSTELLIELGIYQD